MEAGEIAVELIVARIDEAQLAELEEGGDESVREPLEGARSRREQMTARLAEASADEGVDPLPYAWDYLQRRTQFLEDEVRALRQQHEATEARTAERREANTRLQEARRILKHTKKLAEDPMFDQVRDA